MLFRDSNGEFARLERELETEDGRHMEHENRGLEIRDAKQHRKSPRSKLWRGCRLVKAGHGLN